MPRRSCWVWPRATSVPVLSRPGAWASGGPALRDRPAGWSIIALPDAPASSRASAMRGSWTLKGRTDQSRSQPPRACPHRPASPKRLLCWSLDYNLAAYLRQTHCKRGFQPNCLSRSRSLRPAASRGEGSFGFVASARRSNIGAQRRRFPAGPPAARDRSSAPAALIDRVSPAVDALITGSTSPATPLCSSRFPSPRWAPLFFSDYRQLDVARR